MKEDLLQEVVDQVSELSDQAFEDYLYFLNQPITAGKSRSELIEIAAKKLAEIGLHLETLRERLEEEKGNRDRIDEWVYGKPALVPLLDPEIGDDYRTEGDLDDYNNKHGE